MVIALSIWSRRYNRSVADFMVANRCAGRYVLAVANGMGWFGAVTILARWEQYYETGFTGNWWAMLMLATGMLMRLSGFVVYRYRETRAMTLAQFFELRYSRRFRIFAGFTCFLGGILNFGVFPSLGARFFIYFCEIPQHYATVSFAFIGLPDASFTFSVTLAITMLILLGIAVMCTWMGGQIAVMLTDFFQGIFTYITVAVVLIYLFMFVDWTQMYEATQVAEAGKSVVNPFDTWGHKSFPIWVFVCMIVKSFYIAGSWQGTQGYNSAAKSPHEQKMAGVLGMWRIEATMTLLIFAPLVIYTIMNHSGFAGVASNVRSALDVISNENVQNQMTVPIALKLILPVGMKGMLAAMVLAAFISTHDTYLHSWGTMFIQDVVMPFRKKPFTPKQHMRLLKIAIIGVAIYAFLFSLFYDHKQALRLFFTVTGAVFMGGAGSCIIGGLYWKRGRLASAWGAMIVSAVLAVTIMLVQDQWVWVCDKLLTYYPDWQYLLDHPDKFPINGAYMSMGVAVCCITTYVTISLFGNANFNLERMLHRGKYASDADGQNQTSTTDDSMEKKGWVSALLKRLGMTKEFTTKDKVLFGLSLSWSLIWSLTFIVGSILYAIFQFSDATWLTFWRVRITILFVTVLVVVVVFVVGGLIDVKGMFHALNTAKRNDDDDGMVIGGQNRGEDSDE